MGDVKEQVKGKRECMVSMWLREEYVREKDSNLF